MANDKFSAEDLFDGASFKKINKEFDSLINKVDEFTNKVIESATELNEIVTQQDKAIQKHALNSAKGIKDFIAAEKEQIKTLESLSKALVQIEKLQQERAKTEAAQAQALTKLATEKAKQQKIDEKNLVTQGKIIAKEKEKQREYNKLQAALSGLNKRISDLLVKQAMGVQLTTKETIVLQRLQEKQKQYDKTLKDVDNTLGRHQRNVGNYTTSIKEAINSTGAFGGVLGELRNGFDIVKKGFENADTATKKFGAALKGLGILAIISAIADIKNFIASTSAGEEMLERLSIKAEFAFKAAANGIVPLTDAYNSLMVVVDIYITQLQTNREAVRQLNAENARLQFQIKDITEDINDQTLSLETRRKKELELINEEKRAAEIKSEIAERELSSITLEILAKLKAQNVSTRLTKEEIKDGARLNEIKEFFNNEDLNRFRDVSNAAKIADLELQDIDEDYLKRLREIADADIERNLEFIRQKKLVGKQYDEELKSQAESEKKSLEDRAKSLTAFVTYTDKLSKKALEIIRNGVKARLEATEAEKGGSQSLIDGLSKINLERVSEIDNAFELDKFVNSLGLNESERLALLKEIRKIKDAEAEVDESRLKLADDTLAMQKRIAELEETTAQRRREENIKEIELAQQSVDELGKKYEQEIIDKKLFNKSLFDFRKALFEQSIKLVDEEAKAREESLKKQREDELKNAQSIPDIEEQFAKELDIIQDYDQKEIDAKQATADKKKKIDEEYSAFRLNIEQEQVKEIAHMADELLGFVQQNQAKKFDQINANIADRIDKNESRLEEQRTRAAEGLNNELAFREAQADKLKAIEQREAERQEKMQEVLAYIKLFTGYAAENPETALANTLRDMALMTAGKLLYANEGDEFVTADQGTKNAARMFAKGNDKVPAMLAEGERVITADKNSKYYDALHAIHNDTFSDKYLPSYAIQPNTIVQTDSLNGAMLSGILKANNETVKRIASLEKTIANKPETHFGLTNLGEVIETKITNGLKKVTVHQKPKFKT